MQRKLMSLLLSVVALACLLVVAKPSFSQVPGNSIAYGKSLGEWMKTYWHNVFTGGPGYVGKVCLLPIPDEEYLSGSGTAEDPAILKGHGDVTLKPGTPFVLPIVIWYGEKYLDGAAAVNPDPPLPQSLFDTFHIKIKLDGKTIINDANKASFYVGPQYFDSPIYYPEPTSYGSIAATFVQGYVFVHQPLCKGVHTLSLQAEFLLPAGFYVNAPAGSGARFQNTWTITVR